MNHDDADAFDVLPLLRGVYAGGHWLLTEHSYLFHRRMGCTVISDYLGIFLPLSILLQRHSVGLRPRVSAFSQTVQLIEQEWRPILWYFMFKTKPSSMCHSLLGLPCVTCQSLSAVLRFIAVIHSHLSRICSDNALCRVLQIPFQFKRASSGFDSLKQTAKSQREHIVRMLLRCRRRITSVTDRNRQRCDRLFMHSNEK